jgi:hypothetical protein
MHIYVPGEGWPAVDAGLESITFYHKNRILRKWYYLRAEYDPSIVDEFKNQKLPETYELYQNHPNPFNPNTTIKYKLPITNYVELMVVDLLGQKVNTLISEKQNAGQYQVDWDASGYSSGVYLYILKAGKYIEMKKMILLR